jgi:2-oxoglutarate dehydrogenase E1 component
LKNIKPVKYIPSFSLKTGKVMPGTWQRIWRKIRNDLQERLDEEAKPLPYKYQQPEIWWRSLRRATPADLTNRR